MFTNLKKVVASILLVSMVITSNGFSSFAATMVRVVSSTEMNEGDKRGQSLFVAKTKEAGSYFETFGSLYHYEDTMSLYNSNNGEEEETEIKPSEEQIDEPVSDNANGDDFGMLNENEEEDESFNETGIENEEESINETDVEDEEESVTNRGGGCEF